MHERTIVYPIASAKLLCSAAKTLVISFVAGAVVALVSCAITPTHFCRSGFIMISNHIDSDGNARQYGYPSRRDSVNPKAWNKLSPSFRTLPELNSG
jgi:hypothetical protein